jgi:2-keto-4-pentenoate hydratase/2-oxohepta-3-ene-1,7-dioic acid hydratase in catechol pathway
MRLGTYVSDKGNRACAIVDEEIVDLGEASPDLDVALPEIFERGDDGLAAIQSAIDSGNARKPLSDVKLTAPVRPRSCFGVGLNYPDHAAEAGREIPEWPTIFGILDNSISGPFDPIEKPIASDHIDYETELAIVIGRRCRHVSRADAPSVVAGFTICNDVSVRDWQRRVLQWTVGKSFDTHTPLGPWIVTPDELGDPHNLAFRTLVNGEVRQESNTSEMVFDCWDLIEYLSTACTLQPGDVIATGTCGGVALFREGQPWLKVGDVVRCEVDGIGAQEASVVAEQVPAGLAA